MSRDWQRYRLGDLVSKVGSGSTPRGGSAAYQSSGTPLIRSMNVVFFGFKYDGLAYIDDQQAAALDNARVAVNDVLLNITGASIGRVTLVPSSLHDARVNQHVCIIRPAAALDARFLNAFLSSPEMQGQIWADNYGVTRQALTKQQVLDFEVPVPPLDEQRRIADKLDTMLACVDACRDRLARVAPLLKRFRRSVLAAAMSGRLITDIEPTFNSRLESLASLGDVAGGLTKNARRDQLALRRPYLRVANVQANELRLHDVSVIGLTEGEFAKTKLREGDLLIVEGNGSIEQIGRVAMWSGEIADCCHQNHLIRWRAGARLLPKFALGFLLSPEGRRQIEAVASSTTGLHTLSVSKVGQLQVPVPTLQLQSEIVRRVETLFAFADRLEARLAQAQTAADRLTPSLLAKAFRGELVPQDPADEPAAELLKRLAASRTAEAPKTRRGRQGQPA